MNEKQEKVAKNLCNKCPQNEQSQHAHSWVVCWKRICYVRCDWGLWTKKKIVKFDVGMTDGRTNGRKEERSELWGFLLMVFFSTNPQISMFKLRWLHFWLLALSSVPMAMCYWISIFSDQIYLTQQIFI